MPSQNFVFGPYALDNARSLLFCNGRNIPIGHKSFALLQALLRAGGEICTKTELLDLVWPDTAVEESNLSVQVAALRKLLGPSPDGIEWIVTVPRVGYRFLAPSSGVEPTKVERGSTGNIESHNRASIAILPLRNLSDDPSQDYLADGITEDIITALARFRWFGVASRSSSFLYKGRTIHATQIAKELDVQYLLEGSFRKSGDAIRISVQLVEGDRGQDIWAEKYDVEMMDAFAVQDAIAERVAAAIEPELLKSDSGAAVARHTGNMTAWNLVRKGTWHFHQVQREGHIKSLELFREACRLDPELPEAHIWLARVGAGVVAYGWADDVQFDIREGIRSAIKAVSLDERNAYAHYALAITSCFAGLPEQAKRAAERSIEISPTFALGHAVLGFAHLLAGQATQAAASLENCLRLNPNDPQNFVWFNLLAFAEYFSNRIEEAIVAASRSVKVRPNWRPAYEILALCQVSLGQPQDAARSIRQMEALEKPQADPLNPVLQHNPLWFEKIAKTLLSLDLEK